MLRIMAARDPAGTAVEVGDVLAAGQEQDPGQRPDGGSGAGKELQLRTLIWGDSRLDAARMRYSLARFCDVSADPPGGLWPIGGLREKRD